jgi:sugar phosphate isomerase/epimerase
MSNMSSDFPVGVQLYTVREACASDFLGTLRRVRSLGYRYVEGFSGLFGATPAQVETVLQQEDLAVLSAHVDLLSLEQRLPEAVDTWAGLGCQTLVCPWVDEATRTGPDAWQRLGDRLAAIGEQVAAAGLGFAYHNHDFELSEVDALEILLARCPAEHLGLELDVFWARHAGRDPATWILDHADRVRLLHLKDGTHDPLGFLPLGAGESDLAAVLEAARTAGVAACFVEQDDSHGDPFDDLAQSAAWLRTQGLL